MLGEQQRYSGGAILLHWLIALMLAGEIALGFAMPRDASGFELFQLHKSIGITILLLSVLRLIWRFTHKRPAKLEGGINGFLASAVHVGFYVVMIAVPLTGWAIVSTSSLNIPTLLFGTVPWPHLPLPEGMNGLFEESHELLAFFGLGLFVLHVLGALRHHFLIKDALLARMGPGGSKSAVLVLMLAVIGLGLGVFYGLGGGDEHDHDHEDELETPEDPVLPPSAAEEEGRVPLEAEAEAEEEPEAEEEVVEEAEADSVEEPVEAAAPPPSWTIQPGGRLAFNVDNGGMALNGSFARWSGSIVMDPDAPETARIAIEIDLASASLGDGTQDGMLKGPDFLGAGANPTATWRATSVRKTGANSFSAQGTLSLKGASRPQAITFTLSGSGNTRSVSGNATIDRNAFGVGVGSAAENVAPNVNVTFAFDAVR